MKTEKGNTAIIVYEVTIEEIPFVHEECGDTMWDEVWRDIEGKAETV